MDTRIAQTLEVAVGIRVGTPLVLGQDNREGDTPLALGWRDLLQSTVRPNHLAIQFLEANPAAHRAEKLIHRRWMPPRNL
jgi:hypothetical protein